MKSIPAKCKICDTPLFLAVDETYEHDIYKLVPLATCNRCFDLRERRIKLERRIKTAAYVIELENQKQRPDPEVISTMNENLTLAARKFSQWCADLLRRQHAANVGYLSNALIEQPGRWYNHLRDFENAANQA